MSGQGLVSWREIVEELVYRTRCRWIVHVDYDVVVHNSAGGIDRGEGQELLLVDKDGMESLYSYRYLPWETGQSSISEDRERIQRIIESYKNGREWTGYIFLKASEEDDRDFQIDKIIFPF